jgi:hypothetical protein
VTRSNFTILATESEAKKFPRIRLLDGVDTRTEAFRRNRHSFLKGSSRRTFRGPQEPRSRKPGITATMFERAGAVEHGGLASYTADEIESYRRAAVYIDKNSQRHQA